MKTLIKSMLLKGSQNCDTKFQNKIQKNNLSEKFFKNLFVKGFYEMFLQIKKLFYFCHRVWRDGRVVERGGLENR